MRAPIQELQQGAFKLILTRRDLLLSAAALSLGSGEYGSGLATAFGVEAKVRQPNVGQSWTYSKRDLVTRAMIDIEVDQISAVGQSVEIESHSKTNENNSVDYPSWGLLWLEKHRDRSRSAAPAPTEVQDPWGMVLVDSHWAQLQVYEKPIPLVPAQLRPGWSTTVGTRYMVPGSEQRMPWQLAMHAHRWESIATSAGHFTALLYTNLINFRHTNASGRVAGQRKERIWFAPEVGRWVVRESSGTFYQDVAEPFNEDSYRWELLSWT